MTTAKTQPAAFREGDEVVLVGGSYVGTLGVFLRLRPDARWAEMTERNGSVRSHAVEWMAHAKDFTPGV